MLAAAVGPNLTKLLHDQLDLMFACGLSEPLRHALEAIVRCIPPLLKTIHGKAPSHSNSFTLLTFLDRLLDLLSHILSGQPYVPLGAPQSLGRPDVVVMTRDMNVSQVTVLPNIT